MTRASVLPTAIANAVGQVEHVRQRLEADQHAAEEALTQWFEVHLTELSKRFPKRTLEASSGMGSLSVDISGKTNFNAPDHHPPQPWTWIWGATDFPSHNACFKELAEQWEAMLDEFSDRTGIEYVNFTRTVKVGPLA